MTSRGGDSCPKIRKKEQVTSWRPHSKDMGFKIVNTDWSFPASWKVLQAPAGNGILKAGADDLGCSFQASPRGRDNTVLLDRRNPGPEVKPGHNAYQWAAGLESKPPDSAGSP